MNQYAKLFKNIFIFLVSLNINHLYSFNNQIVEAKTFKELNQFITNSLEEADLEKTLIIFDIDHVLVECPLHSICHNLFKKKYLDENTLMTISSIAMQKCPECLVDKEMPGRIKQLQEETTVMCLTSSRIGKFGLIESHEDFRITSLLKLGFDFRQSFQSFPEILFETTENPFLFKSGILFSNVYAKGPVLKYFLERIAKKIKYIIFADDRIENLKSVKKTAKELGIETYLGVHYTKIYNSRNHPDFCFEELLYQAIIIANESIETYKQDFQR